MVFQRQVGEVGDALGPLDEREELLVSSVADVGDRVVCLTKRGIPRKRAEGKRRIHQRKSFDNHNLHRTRHRVNDTQRHKSNTQ